MRKTLVLPILLLFFLKFSSHVFAIPGGVSGGVYYQLPNGTRGPLPGVKISRMELWGWGEAYCDKVPDQYKSNLPDHCWGYFNTVETTSDNEGNYTMANEGNNPAPIAAKKEEYEDGSYTIITKCLAGERGRVPVCRITPTNAPIIPSTSYINCPDPNWPDYDPNQMICVDPPITCGQFNWCGFSCGYIQHRWGPYFPQGYRLPGNLENLGYSHRRGKWYRYSQFGNPNSELVVSGEYFAKIGNSGNYYNADFIFILDPPVTPTPTSTPTSTPTLTPTNTPTPTSTPTSTPTLTPTNTPTPTPTIIYVTATPAPTGSARYQSPIRDNVGYIWVCLEAEAYSGNDYGAGLDHRLKVSGQLPHSYNQDIYIVGCVTRNQSVYCTTGDESLDRSFRLNRLTQHTFQVIHPQNPFRIPTNTNQIEAYVRSTTRDFMTHTVYAVYINPSSGINVGQGGLQQATTVFSSNAENKCILIKWDPKGRVLDYFTKKPIANVEISLFDEKGKKIVEPGLVNPYKTNEDGQFNFYVDERENNFYRLKIDLPSVYQLIGEAEPKNIPQEFKDESKYIIYHPELKVRGDEKKEVIIFLKPKRDNILIRILRFFVE
jgi:5-hydroxyisourate hydrolase-like protein (transthyretin family)